MGTTRRMSEAAFPHSLMMMMATGPYDPSDLDGSRIRQHNAAIQDFVKDGMGAVNGLTRGERAILALAAGIEQWISSGGYGADGVLGPNVTYPLLDAFRSALDADNTGRLDCGTLSDWAECRLRELGINPDTGEWL